jgi:phosphatidylinositol dimannoside acyltransferase
MRFGRVYDEFFDAWSLGLVPILAIFIPWRVCYYLYKRIVVHTSIFEPDAKRAYEAMAKRIGVSNSVLRVNVHAPQTNPLSAKDWLLQRRLTTLIDHADLYLSFSHLDCWFKRRITVRGSWPTAQQAALILTFHWGAGMLALHDMRSKGHVANMLVNAARPEHFKGRWIRYAYIRARINRISLLLGRPTIDAQTNMRPALKALEKGEHVIAVIDVPVEVGGAGHAAQAVTLLARQAYIPRPLLRYATANHIPVTVYLTGIDFADGHRTLDIHTLGCFDSVGALADRVFSFLNIAIETSPPSWHLWAETPRFFRD